MREPPRLAESLIQAVLQTHYDLSNAALTFLALGNDLGSFVYRVDTGDGTRYFLKVRANAGFSAPSLTIPRFFYEQGIPHIIPPVPTNTHELWVRVSDFCISVYPFIDARHAADTGLTLQQWRCLGETIRRIHTNNLPPDLRQTVRRETFIPSRRQLLTDLESMIADNDLADPLRREISTFWQTRQEEIRRVINRADALGNKLRQASLPLVLCHADLHTWNVLVDMSQHMWIVDWDEIIMAPKERDLMFVIGGIGRDLVSAQEAASFVQGYGDAPIDLKLLVYYRYAWAVQDMAAYAEEALFTPDLSDDTRHAAVRGFIDLFAPGNIVEIARISDNGAL